MATTQAGWYWAFEKDAATRQELTSAVAAEKIQYEKGDEQTRAQLATMISELHKGYGELRTKVDTMQSDLSEFKADSQADRRGLTTKVDMILTLLTTKKALETEAMKFP